MLRRVGYGSPLWLFGADVALAGDAAEHLENWCLGQPAKRLTLVH